MNEQETILDIIAWLRMPREGENAYLTAWRDEIADRLEAAHKREAITPKSNPDWKDICAKCKDGDILPEHCEYFGEPNGCNSPIYGEHPTAEKSSAVGDCAKLREALQSCLDTICRIVWIDDPEYDKDGHYLGANYAAVSRDKARAALAAPPRNCDRFASAEEAFHAWNNTVDTPGGGAYIGLMDWLFAYATEKEGGDDGNE